VDELEAYLRADLNRGDSFKAVASPTGAATKPVAHLDVSRSPRRGERIELIVDGVSRPITLLEPGLYATVEGRRLRVDEGELSRLGWIIVHGTAEPTASRYTLRTRGPAPDDPRLLAAEVRALATCLVGGEAAIRVPMASPAAQLKAARDSAREDIPFALGFFAIPVMPVLAVAAGILGVGTGLTSPLEGVFATALTLLVLVLLFVDLVYKVVIGWTTDAVAWLTPVPVVGALAYAIAMTLVLWLPIVVFAVVATLL